jgi:integrase
VGRLLRAIDHYAGNFGTKCALQLSALVMMRQGAFIRAEWQEINLETATWVIEVKHMKADSKVKRANRAEDQHVIPLSRQALVGNT